MSGEEGLRGSWFTGTITQLQHGFALVAYDELNVSEDSDEKLQEWFPLPGAIAENQSLLGCTHDANFGPEFHIRPSPPAEVGQSHLLCTVHSIMTTCIQSLLSSSVPPSAFPHSAQYIFDMEPVFGKNE